MAKILPKLLVLGAVVCATGYAAHRVQTCRVVGIATPTAPAANPVLAYPNAQVMERLKLGYELYLDDGAGHMTALPLPPNTAAQTTLILPALQHRQLMLALANDKCAAPVVYRVSRADARDPLDQGQLSLQARRQQVDLADAQGSLLVVQLQMSDGAQNNWFCNVSLQWNDKP
jgi:hypothetical protein